MAKEQKMKSSSIGETQIRNITWSGKSQMKQVGTQYDIYSVTILPVFGGKCDSENLVGSAHKQP